MKPPNRRFRGSPVATALSIALGLATVSCGAEPEEFSSLTGDWVSSSSFLVPSLTLDLLEADGGRISGTVVMTLGRLELQAIVDGAYAHPEVRLSFTDGTIGVASYTGTRVDDNTIDGDFVLGLGSEGEVMRLTRLSPAEIAGGLQASGVQAPRGRKRHAADQEE